MSRSKSGRTKCRLIVLAGPKHGGATKLRAPIIMGFNCGVRSQGITEKMHQLTLIRLSVRPVVCQYVTTQGQLNASLSMRSSIGRFAKLDPAK